MASSLAHPRIALVTGANRGIGFEIVRLLAKAGMRPVLAARDREKGERAVAALNAMGIVDIALVVMDVSDSQSVREGVCEVERRIGPIDILVNNAAVMLDVPADFESSLFEMADQTLQQTFETNAAGPARTIQAIVPGMRARGYGRVVNLSSRAGQFAGMGKGFPAYRLSKAALNAMTIIAAREAKEGDIKINAMCPGWCRTELGGPAAERSAAEGADTAIWLATLGAGGPTGKFFYDRKIIPW